MHPLATPAKGRRYGTTSLQSTPVERYDAVATLDGLVEARERLSGRLTLPFSGRSKGGQKAIANQSAISDSTPGKYPEQGLSPLKRLTRSMLKAIKRRRSRTSDETAQAFRLRSVEQDEMDPFGHELPLAQATGRRDNMRKVLDGAVSGSISGEVDAKRQPSKRRRRRAATSSEGSLVPWPPRLSIRDRSEAFSDLKNKWENRKISDDGAVQGQEIGLSITKPSSSPGVLPTLALNARVDNRWLRRLEMVPLRGRRLTFQSPLEISSIGQFTRGSLKDHLRFGDERWQTRMRRAEDLERTAWQQDDVGERIARARERMKIGRRAALEAEMVIEEMMAR